MRTWPNVWHFIFSQRWLYSIIRHYCHRGCDAVKSGRDFPAFSNNLLSCLQDLRFSQRSNWRLSSEMWLRADWWRINDENNYLPVDTASQPTEPYTLSAQTVLKMDAVCSSESSQTTTNLYGITYLNVLLINSRILCPKICTGLITKPHEASWQSFISSRNPPYFFNMRFPKHTDVSNEGVYISQANPKPQDKPLLAVRFRCFKTLFFLMPPHVYTNFRGPPSWLWRKCNRLLKLGSPLGAVTLSRWCEGWYI